METEYKTILKERYKQEKKRWIARVTNLESDGKNEIKIQRIYTSELNKIEDIIHKVELDLMTNLHFNFENPIMIEIKEVKE